MQVNGYFLPLEYSCCNLLQNCKDTLFTPAFGLFGAAFLRNAAKPLFFLISFIVSVFNAHRKKREWFPLLSYTRHGAGRVIHFRRFDYFANFAVSRQNNLIYDAEEKNGY